MIWIVGAALVVILGVALGGPMLAPARGRGEPDAGGIAQTGAARDLAIYRDQLRAVEADAGSDRISQGEAEQLRAEIGRRLLDADRSLRRDARDRAAPPVVSSGHAGRLAGVLGLGGLALVLLGGVAAYDHLGAPDMPDAPREARLEAARMQYDNRPGQAEAEARAPVAPPPDNLPEGFDDLMAQLRARMAEKPEARGLAMLADYEGQIGNLVAARQAMSRLVELEGDRAGPGLHLEHAVRMIDAAGGLITPEAEAELDRVLAGDPGNPRARFLRGLLLAQTGRPDRTFAIWRQLLAEGPADAPWIAPIQQNIQGLAWLAGDPDFVGLAADARPDMPAGALPDISAGGLPDISADMATGTSGGAAGALPALDPDAVAAVQEMSAKDQAELIAGMVAGLENRLATEGGPAEDWARLIMSLTVQHQTDRARAIGAEARSNFADDPAGLAVIEAAMTRAGLD